MTTAQPPAGTTVPNVTPLSEWGVRLHGVVATCVEAAMIVLAGPYHLLPVNIQTDKALAQAMIAQGLASQTGASNWASASTKLKQLGLDNTAYGPAWFHANNWQPVVDAALRAGTPVLFGLSNAYNLRDTYTRVQVDRGVYGHAITLVGKDSFGYIAADPNTPTGGFNHYTAANLIAAGASSMVIPTQAPPGAEGPGPGGVLAPPPGMAPLAMALDDVEQFAPFDGSNVMGSILADSRAFFARALFVFIGLVIFLTALWWLVRPQVQGALRTAEAIGPLIP